MIYKTKDIERFLSTVVIGATDECWPKIGAKLPKGYAKFKLNNREVYAHRFSYRIYHGPFDYGLQVMHTCDNPRCVNPFHLMLGTNTDNINDKVVKGRTHLGKAQKNNKSGYPGVSWKKDKSKWSASIFYNGKNRWLGYFDSPEEASQKRNLAFLNIKNGSGL